MSLLSLRNVSAYYGPNQALFDINLNVEPGQVVAMMGRNGMGKSTTVKTICRMIPVSDGQITFDGHDLAALPSHKAARLGLGLVPEGRRCFAGLTVAENLTAAARPGYWDMKRVAGLFPRLGERSAQLSASLSGGEQQMLAIGRALMTNPRLLILDEATEGLAPLVRREIWTAIAKLKTKTGLSILMVDKSIKELAEIADQAVILNRGKTVWQGEMEQLSPEMTDQYLGI